MTTPSPTPQTEYDSAELLELIRIEWREDNEQDAKTAFDQLYYRHCDLLFQFCYKAASQLDFRDHSAMEDFAEGLTQDIWAEIWEGNIVENFSSNPIKASTPEKAVELWLGGIVRIRIKRLVDEAKDRRLAYQGFSPLSVETDEIDFFLPNPPEFERVNNALNSLDPVDKEILLISYEFETMDKNGKRSCRIDKEIQQALMDRHSLSPASLRKRRERALKKLKAALS